ncbi:ribbon-helix-helix protein, CopG family [Aureimonas sp. D3]|uniref:ribbon-helix-helix protein, CopG family n=1 Tax=Aureimonas sp. D3 TaxID=1638164 RepID=UPI0007815DA2|nr:ribbon-helix-helix protein, CopG family [Aureimonas sp. D3]
MPRRTTTEAVAATRARRRAAGLRSTETVLHESEIAALDEVKERLGVQSRSDVIRVLIAKSDLATLTEADADLLKTQEA